MSISAQQAQAVANAITSALSTSPSGAVSQTSSPAPPKPDNSILGGYGYHITHLISLFTILAGLLGTFGLFSYLGVWATFGAESWIVALGIGVTGVMAMAYAHMSFNASATGIQVAS